MDILETVVRVVDDRLNPTRADGRLDEPTGPGAKEAWHPCPVDSSCRYCGTLPPIADEKGCDWSFIDAVYCISLVSRPDRAAALTVELHRLGLCRRAIFYRPERHPKPKIGIWESHRAVALDALGRGFRHVLVLEDDARFARWVGARTVRRVRSSMAKLPAEWSIFFLGHFPLSAWFIGWNTLRTRSGCAHAYVASPRLLAWLAERRFGEAPIVHLAGSGVDAAFAALSSAYAYFPMLAVPSASRSDHFMFATRRPIKRWKQLVIRSPVREHFLSKCMRIGELLTVSLSPVCFLLDRIQIYPRLIMPSINKK